MNSVVLPGLEGIAVRTPEQRKALGQFFTGSKLSSLLAQLAQREGIRTAIDPMCGSGDLLVAVREALPSANLYGIDVDPKAVEAAIPRFAEDATSVQLVAQSAFEPGTIPSIGHAFDLVITNPPYVRYQSISKGIVGLPQLSPMDEIRRNLLQSLGLFAHLSEEERRIFRVVIESYSGLSDLAVPSWILCSMMLQPGGTLALVVPETWLSRDYAGPIQYLLHKLFRLQFIVEDEARCWFPDAQVKATLVVARRVLPVDLEDERQSAVSWIRAVVPKGAGDRQSVVGALYPGNSAPDRQFAEDATRLLDDEIPNAPSSIFVRHSKTPLVDSMITRVRKEAWFLKLEPTPVSALKGHGRSLPLDLAASFPELSGREFTTLDQIGYNVGQGLRTGANEFFYWTVLEQAASDCLLESSARLRARVRVPSSIVSVVVRRQAEVNGSLLVKSEDLDGRVLVLDGVRHPSDAPASPRLFDGEPILPEDLARVIDQVSRLNVGTTDEPRFIPELSAVKTNESGGGRRWYMLPRFAKRHLPELFIARINAKEPRAILNSTPPAVVDANFTTLWRERRDAPAPQALFAFLHSSWALACMELEGTVMGGGALKLEATHLRRLLVPAQVQDRWPDLLKLGLELLTYHAGSSEFGECRQQIDRTVNETILGLSTSAGSEARIREILATRLKARSNR